MSDSTPTPDNGGAPNGHGPSDQSPDPGTADDAPTEFGIADEDVEMRSGSGERHALAIGYYIGSLVGLFGLIVLGYGLFGPEPRPAQAERADLNLWWGLVLLVVGLGALAVNAWTRRRPGRGR